MESPNSSRLWYFRDDIAEILVITVGSESETDREIDGRQHALKLEKPYASDT